MVRGVGTDLSDILKTLIGFGDGFNVGRKRQEGIKDVYKFLNLATD